MVPLSRVESLTISQLHHFNQGEPMTITRALSIVLLGAFGCGSHPSAGGGGGAGSAGSGGGGGVGTNSIHLASPSFTIQPGQEVFKCWYTTINSSAALQAVQMHSTMTPGSHHFIVYTTQTPLRPDGTFEDCANNQGLSLQNTPVWLYATQDPEATMNMPAGTALPLKASQPLYFNMHYLNATPSPMTVHVTWDVTSAEGTFQQVGAFITYNTQISIPPNGTQTVSGNCDVPSGAQFFTMSTHSHKYTVDAIAAKWVNGGQGPVLVHTTDWGHAQITNWGAPSFMTFAPGEQLHYECTYQNSTANTITVGESAATNEMCMAVGYYFPATGDVFCLNSTIYPF
jgi:hypothetical protein